MWPKFYITLHNIAACHPRNIRELIGKKGMHKIKMLLNKKERFNSVEQNKYYNSNDIKLKTQSK